MLIRFFSILEICAARLCRLIAACFIVTGLLLSNSHAATLSADLEVQLVRSVSTSWQTVALANSYTSAIPICTYNLISFSGANPNYDYPPAVVRIRNITSNSIDVRLQGWEDAAAATADVHCLIADTGAHKLPSGTKFEAHSVLSDQTSGRYSTDGAWNQALLEDVSSTLINTYTNPVVLGQVISYNDNRASVFHTSDCESRQTEPFNSGFADGICVGKHIGQIAGNRNSETIGYLVAETGSGTANGIAYELARGGDAIAGNSGGNVGYSYLVAGDYSIGVASQVGEDGGDGSWAVLYGADPLPVGNLVLAVDEETVNADTSRNHTKEIVDYWVFGAAEITLQKKVVNDSGGTATESDFKLGASGPESISGFTGDSAITDVSVAPGYYSLEESGPAGYTGTWSCTGGSLTGASITLKVGDDVVCTLVNDDILVPPTEAYLTLEKKVVNDNGGDAVDADFKLIYDNGAGSSGAGAEGDAAVTAVIVAPGLYKLTEGSVLGYALIEISCTGTDTDGMDGLEIDAGEKVTCTFVNDDKGVDLIIDKQVNDLSPNVGGVVTFTIKVINNGPDNATDVHIVDVVKPGFSYVAASMTGGDVMVDTSPAGTGLDWGITNLAPGASVTLTFQATVSPP